GLETVAGRGLLLLGRHYASNSCCRRRSPELSTACSRAMRVAGGKTRAQAFRRQPCEERKKLAAGPDRSGPECFADLSKVKAWRHQRRRVTGMYMLCNINC